MTRQAMAAVIARHARATEHGGIARCKASTRELVGDSPWIGSIDKPIYDNREAADAAARELAATGLTGPLRSYPCRRSRHNHYHLTSKRNGSDW